MLSPSNKNIIIYGTSLFLFAFIILVAILYLQDTPSNKIKKAKSLISNWKLEEAEIILQEETKKENPQISYVELCFKTFVLRGKFLNAEEYYKKYFAGHKDVRTDIKLDFAEVNYYLGNIGKADSICSNIIDNTDKKYSPKDISRAYKIGGLNKFFLGDYNSALKLQRKALTLAKFDNAMKEEADALRQLGVLSWYKGELDSALNNYYQPALKIYRNINDKIGEATTLSDIGLLYFDWKDWKKEFFYQLKALVIRQKIGDLMGIADSYNFFEHFPKLSKELESLKYNFVKRSYNLSKELGYKWGMEVASNSLQQFFNNNYNLFGRFSLNSDSVTFSSTEAKLVKENNRLSQIDRIKSPSEAIKVYKNIFQFADALGYVVMQFNSLFNLTNLYIDNDLPNDAFVTFNKARALAYSSVIPKFNTAALGILKAKLEIKNKNFKAGFNKLKSLTLFYDSLYISNLTTAKNSFEWQTSVNSIYYYRQWAYSLLLDLLFELNDHERFFQYAEKERSLIKLNFTNGENSFVNDEFIKLFKKLTTIGKNGDGDFVINRLLTILQNLIDKERQKSKSVSDIMKIKKIETDQTITSFRKLLRNDEIFLEYSLGEKYFYVQMICREKTSLIKIPLTQNELTERIIFFHKAIERGKWNTNDKVWQAPALYLYNFLLGPVLEEEQILTKKKLVLSPCNILLQLPFAALLIKSDEENNFNALINNFAISYVYSGSDYSDYLRNPKYHFESLLAFAPDGDELKYSEKEISNIPTALFSKRKTYYGDEATLEKFYNQAHLYDVIHISSHSEIDVINPRLSKIKFHGSYLKLIDLHKYKIKAELVVLSSCESGMSIGSLEDIATSLDLESFPKAILSSGSKCVLSTLWKVDDFSTSEIITHFYNDLLNQKKTENFQLPEALSSAQRKFFTTQINKNHPFYWAPFMISN